MPSATLTPDVVSRFPEIFSYPVLGRPQDLQGEVLVLVAVVLKRACVE